MTSDLDRLLEMNWQYATNNPNYKPSEYQSLKSKIESQLSYWNNVTSDENPHQGICNVQVNRILESKVKALEEENQQLKDAIEKIKELSKEFRKNDGAGEWHSGYSMCISEIETILESIG